MPDPKEIIRALHLAGMMDHLSHRVNASLRFETKLYSDRGLRTFHGSLRCKMEGIKMFGALKSIA